MRITLIIALSILSALDMPLTAQIQQSESVSILIANYHATFRAGEQLRQMKGQAKVRDSSRFPIEFDDFRAFVSLTQVSPKLYEADLVMEKREDSKWRSINLDAVSFQSSFATPTEFQWVENQYSLELVIAVSIITE